MNIETYKLPAYWASALINGDYSGLNDAEEKQINNWLDSHKKEGCRMWCLDCGEESEFSTFKGMGCDLLEYNFDVSPIH